jgi:hypothetical protein
LAAPFGANRPQASLSPGTSEGLTGVELSNDSADPQLVKAAVQAI